MVSDPRCPDCAGKVSSTATWCMHCGEDFPSPVDADSGRAIRNRHSGTDVGEREQNQLGVTEDGAGQPVVGVLVAVFGLITLPFVTPPNMTLFSLAAAVGSGVFAARQSSTGGAVARGGVSLAAAPVVVWFLSLLVSDTGSFSLGSLVGPVVYAVVVSSVARQFD